jgi:hypothetical protein
MIPRYPDGVREVKQRGRPRVEEPRTSVSTWVPATLHDRLIEVANRHEVSVSEYVRQVLIVRLKP